MKIKVVHVNFTYNQLLIEFSLFSYKRLLLIILPSYLRGLPGCNFSEDIQGPDGTLHRYIMNITLKTTKYLHKR